MEIGRLAALAALMMSLTALSAFAAREASTGNLRHAEFSTPSELPTLDHGTWVETTSSSSHWEPRSNRAELVCLAQAIYFEARGESPKGRFAVGRVVLNRVDSHAYPDTICGVVYQNAELANRCQFSFACDGKPEQASERSAWFDALDRAENLVDCTAACPDRSLFVNPLWRSTHFHADYVSPNWAAKLASTGQIGRHLFYRDPSVAPYRSAIFELSERLIASIFAIVGAIVAL